ncbi:MAG: hypothetical protein Q4G26_02535 [Paracoccus sp. (in: a-proteobacteria)]|nr:hypothetical protein [Paracoccus sp. (in: a-proteobacteria)]
MTPLDQLCPAPFHDLPDAARARVMNRLADTELFVALDADPAGDTARLRLFDLGGTRLAIAADQEDRLAGFFGAPTGHLAMPGRALAARLGAEGVTLMVNPGAPSEMLLEPGMLVWLAEALAQAPAETEAAAARLGAPAPAMVAALAGPLAARLGDMAGLAERAGLVAAEWDGGMRGHLLVLAGVDGADRPRIAKALAELMAFLPPLPDPCDLAFDLPLPPGALIVELDQPAPKTAPAPKSSPQAPGMNPEKPPILRF